MISPGYRLCSPLASFSRPLAFLFAPLFCALFYAHCSTKIEPCEGDTTADPEFDCLPYSPELSEPESDGAGNYKIPIKGVDGLDKYEYQERVLLLIWKKKLLIGMAAL